MLNLNGLKNFSWILIYAFLMLIIFYSCKDHREDNWVLDKQYSIPFDLNPTGISNFKNHIVVSDSSADRIIMFDSLSSEIFQDISVPTPVYIKIRKGVLLIPSYERDSIFIYRGKGLNKQQSFGEMDGPVGVDADRIDHFAHVDQGNNRVLYQNKPKNIEVIISHFKNETDRLNKPNNVLLADSIIYVVDSGNNRIGAFSKTGDYLFSFGENEQLKMPTGISANGDTLFISDPITNRILLYTGSGKYLETISNHINKPSGINYYHNKLYIGNLGNNTVTVLKKKY